MLCRCLCVAGALLSLAAAGCRQTLAKDGSYSELKMHAERLDFEFGRFHTDIKEIVFGLERKPEDSVWETYD